MHSSLSSGPQGPDFLCLCCRLSQVQVDVTFPKVPCLSSLILVTTLQKKNKNSGSMINMKFSITISKMVRSFFNSLPCHPDPHPKSVLMWPHILWQTEGVSPLAPLSASRARQPCGKVYRWVQTGRESAKHASLTVKGRGFPAWCLLGRETITQAKLTTYTCSSFQNLCWLFKSTLCLGLLEF